MDSSRYYGHEETVRIEDNTINNESVNVDINS